VSTLAFCLSLTSMSYAQEGESGPTPAQVRTAAEAFDKGREAYKLEDYVEAAEQFERADNNAPSSAAIELAIRARDKAGELDRAASLASLAVNRHPDDANLQKITPDILDRATKQLFALTASCDSPCDLTVGGKIVHGGASASRILFVKPGKLTVRAGWSDNRSETKQIDAEAGGQGELTFAAPAAAPAGAPSEATPAAEATVESAATSEDTGVTVSSTGWSPVVFWVGTGVTAVLGGVTIWSGVDTISNPGTERVERECKGQGESCPLYQEGRDKQARTNILLGATAGVGIATIVVGAFFTDWSGGAKQAAVGSVGSGARGEERLATAGKPSWQVYPWASLDGGGLSATGRF
jgi:hypothetical protein